MHMTVTSQFRRSSCSPLEVLDLHTSWAAVFRRPIFLFLVRLVRRFRAIDADTACARVPQFSNSKGNYIKVPIARRLCVDISPDPLLK